MKPILLPCALPSRSPKRRPPTLAVLLAFLLVPSLPARPKEVELPLILDAERAQLRAKTGGRITLSEGIYYEDVVLRGVLERPAPAADYEPVGLHIDPVWSIRPEPPKQREIDRGRTKTSGTDDKVPLHWMAQSLASYSNKYVLMSARLEKRLCGEFRIRGSAGENVERLAKLLEKEGVEAKLLPHDAFVLLEAPGQERPFRYGSGRPRAVRYEAEREAWLTRNKNHIAQGLIYQPCALPPEAYPERDVRVRHAAAALARLSGKEVFVQPAVEKREFKPPSGAEPPATPEVRIAQITKQLERAHVEIVELDPRSLVLVLEGAKIRSLRELD